MAFSARRNVPGSFVLAAIGVFVSPRVLMKVENAVKVELVGEFALKGIRRHLAAYNILTRKSDEQ